MTRGSIQQTAKKMSILSYFTAHSCLPDSRGTLSRSIPSSAIAAANREMQRISKEKQPEIKGPYQKYTPEKRAEVGRHAVANEVMRAVRKYLKEYEGINESTVRSFKRLYIEEVSKKRRAGESQIVCKLPSKKRGRPVLLGKRLDDIVQEYILNVRAAGGTINIAIVIAGAQGLVKSVNRTMLAEYGGPATLTRGWAKSLLQ